MKRTAALILLAGVLWSQGVFANGGEGALEPAAFQPQPELSRQSRKGLVFEQKFCPGADQALRVQFESHTFIVIRNQLFNRGAAQVRQWLLITAELN